GVVHRLLPAVNVHASRPSGRIAYAVPPVLPAYRSPFGPTATFPSHQSTCWPFTGGTDARKVHTIRGCPCAGVVMWYSRLSAEPNVSGAEPSAGLNADNAPAASIRPPVLIFQRSRPSGRSA